MKVPCSCGKTLQVDDKHRGKKVKCPACGNVVLVEDTPAETAVQAEAPRAPAPAKARRPEAAAKSKMPLIIGIVCVVIGLPLLGCLGAGGVGAWFYYSKQTEKKVEEEQAKVKEDMRGHQLVSRNNLKQITLALHSYHDVNKRFPPYATVHPQTRQMHLSWRVFLLPYLEEGGLHQKINFDEPWDSPHNSQFHTKMPKVYQLPGKPNDGKTYYQVFFGDGAMYSKPMGDLFAPQQIGPKTFGLPSSKNRLTSIHDGTSNTIFAVEAAEPVNWMKPEDILFQASKEGTSLKLVGNHWGDDTFHAAAYDGVVWRMRRNVPPIQLQLMITPDDGQPVDLDQWGSNR